jgi:phage I-like protein
LSYRLFQLYAVTRVPPREFLLFPLGTIKTLKGDFILSADSAAEVMEKYEEHGVDLMLDYEHAGVSPMSTPDGLARAAGWAKLELRDDGIWLSQIKWTDAAAAMLRSGEYRYLSPAFNADTRTKEIVEIVNVALTNLPATHNQRPLVEASRTPRGDEECQIMPLASRGRAKTAGVSLARESAKMAHAMGKKLSAHMAKHDLSKADMAKHTGLSSARCKALSEGDEPSQEEMKACNKFLSFKGKKGEAGTEASLDGAPTNDMRVPNEDSAEETMTGGSSDEAKVSHASDEADESEGESAIPTSRLSRSGQVDLVALTGLRDPSAQAQFLAQRLEKAESLEADVIVLKRENEERARRELVSLGQRDGKLDANDIAFWKSEPVEKFAKWLKGAAVKVHKDGYQELGGVQASRSVEGVELSRDDEELIQVTGSDPKEYAEFKRKLGSAAIASGKPSKEIKLDLLRAYTGKTGKVAEPMKMGRGA